MEVVTGRYDRTSERVALPESHKKLSDNLGGCVETEERLVMPEILARRPAVVNCKQCSSRPAGATEENTSLLVRILRQNLQHLH